MHAEYWLARGGLEAKLVTSCNQGRKDGKADVNQHSKPKHRSKSPRAKRAKGTHTRALAFAKAGPKRMSRPIHFSEMLRRNFFHFSGKPNGTAKQMAQRSEAEALEVVTKNTARKCLTRNNCAQCERKSTRLCSSMPTMCHRSGSEVASRIHQPLRWPGHRQQRRGRNLKTDKSATLLRGAARTRPVGAKRQKQE